MKSMETRASSYVKGFYYETEVLLRNHNPVLATKKGRGVEVLINHEDYAKIDEYRQYISGEGRSRETLEVFQVRDLRKRHAEIVSLTNAHNPIFITKRWQGSSVLLSPEDYVGLEEYWHYACVEEKLQEAAEKSPDAGLGDYKKVFRNLLKNVKACYTAGAEKTMKVMKIMEARPVIDLRSLFPEIEALVRNHNPVLITKSGQGATILIYHEDYAQINEYRKQLSGAGWKTREEMQKQPVRILRNNYPEIELLLAHGNPVFVTKLGGDFAVLLNLEDYAELEEYWHYMYVEEKLQEAAAKSPDANQNGCKEFRKLLKKIF
ncbi:MAG: hypothetical protein Ta2A_16380 [Treponemataceae bacterium]|nr:MAG: hypothetical protein Ta2A_16380 [Treponemataceae bacterium]